MIKQKLLKQYFGHEQFRSGQSDIIDNILTHHDVLGIMPTGAGKSICYQIPALMLEGITIVVSPLISLMKDQVTALIQSGIKAAYLNSSLTASQYNTVLERIGANTYKIIYVAPERLTSEAFLNAISHIKVAMVTVDEAHCVSHWGQDFRPSYLKIIDFVGKLPYRPIISAFTATATAEVKNDISTTLRLDNPFIATTGFDRENLYFEVRQPMDKFANLVEIIENNKDKCGIIYCSTRKNVEEVCEKLCNRNYSATRYHAGLDDKERHDNQERFVFDKSQIMVATNAFGMGIDKSNVSFVVHYNMPKNIEAYYQEAGRAGRDGERAECIILYNGADVRMNQFLIEHGGGNPELDVETQEAIKQKDRERLKHMTYYCTTNDCLREYILQYFGDMTLNYCGNCSNCNTNFETIDITVEAQKIISCVYRAKQNYGTSIITNVLRGSKSEKIISLGLDKLSTYGIMADVSARKIRNIIGFLVHSKYLLSTDTEYPVLKLTSLSTQFLKNKSQLFMKQVKEIPHENKAKKSDTLELIDTKLFAKLKELRISIANVQSVPAYAVFTDASLRDMCHRLPRNNAEFLKVSGVGELKCEKYGDRFVKLINEYLKENPQTPTKTVKLDKDDNILAYILKNKDKINVSPNSVTTTQFAENIMADLGIANQRKVISNSIRSWLTEKDFLCDKTDYRDRSCKDITSNSKLIGITKLDKISSNGNEYYVIIYSEEAQQFVLDNFEEITHNYMNTV